jgi:hypothetical protein
LLADLRPNLLVRRKRYFTEEAEIFAGVIEQGQQSGELSEGNSMELAEIFLLSSNSLLPFSLSSRELGNRDEIEESTLRIANLLLKGLEKKQ